MPKIDAVRPSTTAAVSRAAAPSKTPSLDQAKLLGAVIKAAGEKLEKKEVKTETIDYRSVKLPGGGKAARVAFNYDAPEYKALGSRYNELFIDVKKGQFYVNSWQTLGPLKLPEGFSLAALLTEKPDPKPRTNYEKALVALQGVVDASIDTMYTKPFGQMDWDLEKRTWRKPDGTKLTDFNTDDKRFAMGDKSLFFDLTHKEFYIEQIPGVSGETWGPFKMPKGFDVNDLVKAEKPEKPAKPAVNATRDSYGEYEHNDGRYTGGSGSDAGYRGPRLADIVGGRGSNAGSPMFAYFNNRGGGGGGSR